MRLANKLVWLFRKILIVLLAGHIALIYASNADIMQGAKAQLGKTLYYDPSYVVLSYPGGDVKIDRGVCSDVVIRAFRQSHIDLQKAVHEDMKANFKQYPQIWGLKTTDSNIDHRRVPNLEKWFQRQGKALAITHNGQDYLPGDIVSWRLDNGLAHIGIVSNKKTGTIPWIVHNIGQGAKEENVLFQWRIVGHYRYYNQ